MPYQYQASGTQNASGEYQHLRLRVIVFTLIVVSEPSWSHSSPLLCSNVLCMPLHFRCWTFLSVLTWTLALCRPFGISCTLSSQLAKHVIGNVVIAFTTTGYPYIPLVCLPYRLCATTYSIPEWIWQGLVNSLCQCILIWSANAFLAIRLVSICRGMPS